MQDDLQVLGKTMKFNSGRFKKGVHTSPETEFRRGQVPWNMGQHLSDKHKESISEAKKGVIPWNKGLKGFCPCPRTRFKKGHIPTHIKGKTFEQAYGVEKALEMKKAISKAHKGKTWEQIFGVEKAIEMKKKMSKRLKKEGHPKWVGGRRHDNAGYVLIWNPEHPNATIHKTVLEHRLVMEKHLGRYLEPWEIIHHKNGVKDDNQIENLELLPKSEHNTKVQEVYLENKKLKQLCLFLLLLKARSG